MKNSKKIQSAQDNSTICGIDKQTAQGKPQTSTFKGPKEASK